MTTPSTPYPFEAAVAPPEQQSRLTVLFRPFLVLPQLILVGCLQFAVEIILFIAWFAILFTGSFPPSMYKFTSDVLRWSMRVNGYSFLLTGVYPPFSLNEEPAYPVNFAQTVETEGRNRLTVAFRFLIVLPNLFVLMFVAIGAVFVLWIAWFVALVTGQVPAGMHEFMAGFTRWSARLIAYTWLLTDKYPPFSLR